MENLYLSSRVFGELRDMLNQCFDGGIFCHIRSLSLLTQVEVRQLQSPFECCVH